MRILACLAAVPSTLFFSDRFPAHYAHDFPKMMIFIYRRLSLPDDGLPDD